MTPTPLIIRLQDRLDRSAIDPPSRQVVEALWEEVVAGTLPLGERLPTARQLSIELGLSPRSADRVYRELERLGVVATRPGQGTFVSLKPPPEELRLRREEFLRLCREAVENARKLGFDVDDLLEELQEFRDTLSTSDASSPQEGP